MIQYRNPGEMRERPSLARIVRNRDRMAASGKDETGNPSAERLQESDLSFFECEIDYVAAQRQRLDVVDTIRIWPERVQCLVQRPRLGRRLLRRRGLNWWTLVLLHWRR